MSYIDSSLMAGERVIHKTSLHWVNILMFRLLKYLFNEMVITNLRVIYKEGIVSRRTTEIVFSKIESVSIEQGIYGRLFGFGTVFIFGSGGTRAVFPFIRKPLEFRKALCQQPAGVNINIDTRETPHQSFKSGSRNGQASPISFNVLPILRIIGWILVPYVMTVLYGLKNKDEIFSRTSKEHIVKFGIGVAWSLIIIIIAFSGNKNHEKVPAPSNQLQSTIKSDTKIISDSVTLEPAKKDKPGEVGVVSERLDEKKDYNKQKNSASITSSTEAENESVAVNEKWPWYEKVEENCRKYKEAPNEIIKSEIFNQNKTYLKGLAVSNLKGTIKSIDTPHGGGWATISIKNGDVQLSCIFSPAPKGSKVYKQASNLKEGQCVVFSAKRFHPVAVLEKSQVCEKKYELSFTDLKPCQ